MMACICVLFIQTTLHTESEIVDGIEWHFHIESAQAVVGNKTGYKTEYAIDQSTKGRVVMPNYLGGCPVVGMVPYAFYRCTNLNEVILGRYCTSISEEAFRECGKLGNFVMANSVTNISDMAFFHCDALTRTRNRRRSRLLFTGRAGFHSGGGRVASQP